ncbi:MAG TPA: hypothetical protein VI756_11575 [Blastocatellia bacterium]
MINTEKVNPALYSVHLLVVTARSMPISASPTKKLPRSLTTWNILSGFSRQMTIGPGSLSGIFQAWLRRFHCVLEHSLHLGHQPLMSGETVLGVSRYMYIEFTASMKLAALIRYHPRGIRIFGEDGRQAC